MSPHPEGPPAVLTVALVVGAAVVLSPLAAASVAETAGSDPPRTTTAGTPVPGQDAPRQLPTTAATANATATPTSTPGETTTPAPSPTPTPAATPTPGPTPTATPTPAPSPEPEPTPTATPTPAPSPTPVTAPPGIAVGNLSAPDRIRPDESYTVTATVRNPTRETRAERIEYVFAGSAVTGRTVVLGGGESRALRFELTADGRLTGSEPPGTGTYVHGVRNASGDGAPRYLRVTPDVDLAVEGFRSPATAPGDGQFVVLATVSNPAGTTVTRAVTYRFAGRVVAEKTVTVGGGEEKQVAFAVTRDRIEASGGPVQLGRTYSHSIVTAGGAGVEDAIRLRGGPGASAASLAIQESQFPTEIGEGDRYTVAVTVRNVETAAFSGQFVYRIDGSIVATRSVEIAAGGQRTVRFDVTHPDVERAAFPLPSRTATQSVTAGNVSLASRDVTVHGIDTDTPTPTPRGTATFDGGPDRNSPTVGTVTAGGNATTGDGNCARGFFSRCGGTSLDQMTLTLIGTVSSVLAILYEMFTGV